MVAGMLCVMFGVFSVMMGNYLMGVMFICAGIVFLTD